jgi:hypothetical protein
MATLTGMTFNFNKGSSSDEEKTATAASPSDSTVPAAKVSGEKSNKSTLKDAININSIVSSVKNVASQTLANVSSSTALQAQISAMQQVSALAVSTAAAFATNPYVGIAYVAMQSVSYGFKQASYNRNNAWEDYGLEQLKERRGYSYNRSRYSN